MKFTNKPNKRVKTTDGQVTYLSRSNAVVGEVFLYSICDRQWYVLLGKRGTGVPDFQGYWGFPCGYLDWDERLGEAVIREIWEETGLLINDSSLQVHIEKSYNIFKHEDQMPTFWQVIDDPKSGIKQNISFHYGFLLRWSAEILPKLTIDNAFDNEAESANWIRMEEALEKKLAFNHNQRLEEILHTQKLLFDEMEIQK